MPFYSWNGRLEPDELAFQRDVFEKMGFGGAVMHPRIGLETPYLSEEYMNAVRFCEKSYGEKGMFVGLYDEDKWPSGFAGGFITQNKKYRQRWLLFTNRRLKETAEFEDGIQTAGDHLLRSYCLAMDGNRLTDRNYAHTGGTRLYAYQCVARPTSRYNGATYVDVLNKAAIDEFIRTTYERYLEALGPDFGGASRFIFTDEPQLKAGRISRDVRKDSLIAWTDDFEESYIAAYGESLLDRLPEVFFDFADGSLSEARYRYHKLKTERFVAAYSKNISDWCHAHGLLYTGHMCDEMTLGAQTHSNGEAMAHYPYFDIPGIDILSNRHEYTTAKQVSSVAAQFGKTDVMCELYGAADVGTDFARLKEEGDWLRALGVSLRVPHLSYYTYKGEAKRDYPPSFNYQNAWHERLSVLEDHFARLSETLAGTREVARVGVIHPIESYWRTYDEELNRSFQWLTKELLTRHISFDFISESLLAADPSLADRYEAIVVPRVVRLRESTRDTLFAFGATHPLFTLDPTRPEKLFAALEPYKAFDVSSGEILGSLHLADDGARYLLLTRPAAQDGTFWHGGDPRRLDFTVTVPGRAKPALLDTLTGETVPVEYEYTDGSTKITLSGWDHDSFLLALDAGTRSARTKAEPETQPIAIAPAARYELAQDNALLLDRCAVKARGLWLPAALMLRQTKRVHRLLKLAPYDPALQPYLREEAPQTPVEVRFSFRSRVEADAFFVTEHELSGLQVNGNENALISYGWYIDKCMKRYPLHVKKGRNRITVTVPFDVYTRLENCFVTGRFGVFGKQRFRLGPLPERVTYSSLTEQGFPFYSGVFTYLTELESPAKKLCASFRYRGALLACRTERAAVTAEAPLVLDEKLIIGAPYAETLTAQKGPLTLATDCYITQENAFGLIHIRDKYRRTDSPRLYNSLHPAHITRRYGLRQEGLTQTPEITSLK